VGRQVLRTRVAKDDVPPLTLERGQLVGDELASGRVLRKLVQRRKEKSLESLPRPVATERGRRLGLCESGEVPILRQPRRDAASCDRDLPDGRDTIAHLANGEALGKDDPQPG